MRRTTKWGLGIAAAAGMIIVTLFGYVLYDGPRMKVQPHIRTYQAVMPLPPEGAVPLSPSPYPSGRETAAAGSPVPMTKENIGRGRIWYDQFCLPCHGDRGRGDGPVGDGYFPTPTDLTSERMRSYPPAEIHRRMLTGDGHTPTLERVVRPEYRWYVTAYVMSLGKGEKH